MPTEINRGFQLAKNLIPQHRGCTVKHNLT